MPGVVSLGRIWAWKGIYIKGLKGGCGIYVYKKQKGAHMQEAALALLPLKTEPYGLQLHKILNCWLNDRPCPNIDRCLRVDAMHTDDNGISSGRIV